MSSTIADGIEITYYTDPLCCWSWAMEPAFRKLEYLFRNQLQIRYCMGGLVPGWNNFHDPVNSVSRPIQMGPVWMHASQVSGMKMDANLWFKDAPSSSYPACIAYKCVELQSIKTAGIYLRLLREACMLEGKNIANDNVLIHIAEELQTYTTGFDLALFKNDLYNKNGREAFRADLNEVKLGDIQRFPTWIFRQKNVAPVITSGYQPFSTLLRIVLQLSPGVAKGYESIQADAFKNFWPWEVTPQEMKEALTPFSFEN